MIIVTAKFINEFRSKDYAWIGYSIIIIITFLNIKSLFHTYEILYKTDEPRMYKWSHPSSSIYKLTDYLLENNILYPVTIVPELYYNIRVLTEGKILPDMDLSKRKWDSYIEQDVRYYITRLDHQYKDFFNDFCLLEERYGKSVAIDKEFYRNDVRKDMMVFRLKGKDENNP